jgi:diguanylate cyclase (GGDEF)-like protein
VDAKTRVLVVEDSKFFSHLVYKAVNERIGADVTTAFTFAETKDAVEQAKEPFNLALVDLDLPDAHHGEAAEWLAQQNIPSIVFTGMFSEDLRERLLAQKMIDYVVKDTPSSLEYLIGLVERIHRNREHMALVVDDSRASRDYIRDLLTSYQFQVIEASNGYEGLSILESNPNVRLVLTDYFMPDMNGIELVKRIRLRHNADRLAIIGVSAGGGSALSAQFIKNGANDFLIKPFLREEFFCRINQNLRMTELVDRLTEIANRDALTGIHNRRFLYDTGEVLLANAQRKHVSLTAAIIDMDFFKDINDRYGHPNGDIVLKRIANLIRSLARKTDVVARIGGEEFAILAVNMDANSAAEYFERLRAAIENEQIFFDGQQVRVTASIGVYLAQENDLSTILRRADRMLYKAKEGGRNRVEIS